MAHPLAPIQPLWSFIAPAAPACAARVGEVALPLRAPSVAGWRCGADGRLQMRWSVRPQTPG